jgi:hypothetical protein
MLLFKSDHARRIDRIIDYFGGGRGRRPAEAGPAPQNFKKLGSQSESAGKYVTMRRARHIAP